MVHIQEVAGSNPVSAITHLGNIYRKKESPIVSITKLESQELQQLGHKFGYEGTLHHSYSKHPKYYLTESKKALSDLEEVRKARKLQENTGKAAHPNQQKEKGHNT